MEGAPCSGSRQGTRSVLVQNFTLMQYISRLSCSLATTSTIQPSDAEGDRTEEIRVTVFELEIERDGAPDALFVPKLGDWSFEGPVEDVAAHKGVDGKL